MCQVEDAEHIKKRDKRDVCRYHVRRIGGRMPWFNTSGAPNNNSGSTHHPQDAFCSEYESKKPLP